LNPAQVLFSLAGAILFNGLPTTRTDSEEFQFVRHGGEIMGDCEMRFNFPQETFFYRHNRGAAGANQMMMMVAIAFEFKSRRSIAKIHPLDHVHLFEQMHRAINRRQIALIIGYGRKDFFGCQRMGLFTQDFQDRLARAGDFAGGLAQFSGQFGHFLSL
jgi:hypothetical protein